jgi:ribonuclease D
VTDHIPQATLITAREHLEEVVADIKSAPRLALDIESNGFYAYREKVCLIQFSSPTEDFIVDPIAVSDLSCMAPLMEDPAIEKVFHAGEYDVLCLKRDYNWKFENLFDTMIASRLLGVKELGLAAAIEKHFGIKLSKKLQRADWGKRPLTPEQTRYAQFDTHFLMRLADILKEDLRGKGRLEDAAEAFSELAAVEPVIKTFDPEGYWRLAGREPISGPQLAALREVYIFREEQAQSRDRATFRVMPEDLMARIARALPENMDDLGKVRGMTPYLIQKFGHQLLRCVQRGREAEPPSQAPKPKRERKDMRELKLFEALRLWRKTQAENEGVEPVVVMSSQILHRIAELATQNGGGDPLEPLSTLKRGRYGEKLLEIIKSRPAA